MDRVMLAGMDREMLAVTDRGEKTHVFVWG